MSLTDANLNPNSLDQDWVREQIKLSARDLTSIGEVADAQSKALVRNPFCGDEIQVSLGFGPDDRIEKIQALVRGCLVARAAWSMLAPSLKGLTREEGVEFVREFQKEMAEPNTSDQPSLASVRFYTGPLKALSVYRLPSPRHTCAVLGSEAVLKALEPEHQN